jgi:hypothetical protein
MELFIHLYIVGFIRTLVIIAVVYFAIRLFTRYVLPLILDKKIKDMQHKMREQQKQQQHPNRSEGDVTIEYEKRRNRNQNHDDGEYVDFEEVD